MPCQMVRRSSPEEDYIWTLTGVRNLVEEQNKIMEEIKVKEKERKSQEKACEKFAKASLMDDNLTRSNSSSMQFLRRILEIEEWKRTSDIFNMRMERQSLLENIKIIYYMIFLYYRS